MFLQYKYRWLYSILASIAVITVGFFNTINPKFSELIGLDKKRESLSQQLYYFKRFVKDKNVKKSNVIADKKNNPLSNLFLLANYYDLPLQFIDLSDTQKNKSQEGVAVGFAVKGDYEQISSFVNMLTSAKDFFILLDFTYKIIEQNQYFVEMKVLIPKAANHYSFDPKISAIKRRNPFCFAGKQSNDVELLHSVSLDQIKMIGYLQQNEHKQGMISIANHGISILELGSLIGKEQAIVKEIQQDHVLILMPDKTHRLIKM